MGVTKTFHVVKCSKRICCNVDCKRVLYDSSKQSDKTIASRLSDLIYARTAVNRQLKARLYAKYGFAFNNHVYMCIDCDEKTANEYHDKSFDTVESPVHIPFYVNDVLAEYRQEHKQTTTVEKILLSLRVM